MQPKPALALLAGALAVAPANAFWLIPGLDRHHESAAAAAAAAQIRDESAVQRFRSAIADKYAEVADAAYNAIPTGSGSPKATATPNSYINELLRAFDEVSSDVSYGTTLAKGTLGRGIYVRQNEDTYLLAMDVAGLHTREVEITAEKGTLRVKGERKCLNVVGTGKPDPLCIPRKYDQSFAMPSDADEERADGRLDAGVVTVFVPKIKGQPRGVGRVIKLTGDAADWAYTESGAKGVVDATADTVADTYNSAAGTVNRVVDNVVGSVYGAADTARIAANDASNGAKNAGIAATASVKSAASEATDAAYRASAAAAASASSVSASIASAGHAATQAAAASASAASRSAASVASAATASAKSAAAKASATGAAATASVKAAASSATATSTPSFVERAYENYVKPIKEHIAPTGSAEGSIHINKEEL